MTSKRAGRFILATNVLDSQVLSPDQMLAEYKAQQNTERGLRFPKDPFFFASAPFLKNPQRIMALMMIMVVSLLVHTLAQRSRDPFLAYWLIAVVHYLPLARWHKDSLRSVYFLARAFSNSDYSPLWPAKKKRGNYCFFFFLSLQ